MSNGTLLANPQYLRGYHEGHDVMVPLFDNAPSQVVTADSTQTLTNKTLASPVVTGNLAVANGTAVAPSINFSGDPDTGIYRTDANSLGITTGGTERLRIDASGNLGLGVVPSAWNGGAKAVQIPYGALWNASDALYLGTNYFFNTSAQRIYSNTGKFALEYLQYAYDGSHRWYTAPSGTIGDPITFTQRMMLDASGNLGVQTTPSAWHSDYRVMQVGLAGAVFNDNYNENLNVSSNTFADSRGGFKFIRTGFGLRYVQTNSGQHQWLTSTASGAAGNAISFTQAMTLDASSNLAVTGSVTIGSFTVATRPAHAAGKMIYVSDGGAGAVFQGSNGSSWVNLG